MQMATGKKNSVKDRIVSTAWKLFYQKGYNDTTVDEIIEKSNTSKGSFYYYFKTKDELLGSLSDVLDDYYEELDQTMDPDMNSLDKLLQLNYEVHKLIEDTINIDILASMYSTQIVSSGDRHLLDQSRTYYKLIQRIIQEGQEKHEITTELSVAEITHYYSMCERAIISDWCLTQGSYSLSVYSQKFMPIMLDYLKSK